MFVVIPIYERDKDAALRLAQWIADLGGAGKHDCILAVHKGTDSAPVFDILKPAFRRIREFFIPDELIVERDDMHAYAANVMWKRTVNDIGDMPEPEPWLWLELDAVPLTPDWLDKIDAAYKREGKPFLHDLVVTPRGRSNSGCGVYPPKVANYTERLWELADVSWDILLYPEFKAHTAYTPLIQDIGFLPDGETLPTFPDQESLAIIRPEAVLFHRCKNESLIARLRETQGGQVRLSRKAHNPEIAGSNPAPAITSAPCVGASAPAQSGDKGVVVPPSLTPPRTPDVNALLAEIERLRAMIPTPAPVKATGDKRTPEQKAADAARMAKARAGRRKNTVF